MAIAFCLMVAVFPISFANAMTGGMTNDASNSIATASEIQKETITGKTNSVTK